MSFPADDALANDPEVTFARWKVWRALQPPFLSHSVPTDAKTAVVQKRAKVSTRSVVDALRWLERRGYVVVHGRDRRGTPRLSLAWALNDIGETTTSGRAAEV